MDNIEGYIPEGRGAVFTSFPAPFYGAKISTIVDKRGKDEIHGNGLRHC